MKYKKGIEIICIKDKPNFIKGKAYKIEELTDDNLISIEVKDEKGEIKIFAGSDKTKFFKLPRPVGVAVTPPTPKSKEQKFEEKRQKKLDQEIQANEWKKVRKLKVKDKSKRIFRRASGF